MQVQVDVLTTDRMERDCRGRLNDQPGDHPVTADGRGRTCHGIRLRTAPVVLQHEPAVIPGATRLLAPLNLQPDALRANRVVESVVGAASAALGDHEWRRSPGTVRRKDRTTWLVDQRRVRGGEGEGPVVDHPPGTGLQDTLDQRCNPSDRSQAATPRRHESAGDEAVSLDLDRPGQPVAPIGRRQGSCARDTQRDLQRVVARHGLDTVRHEPQQRPLDADQPDPPSHIHDGRLRPNRFLGPGLIDSAG